MKENGDRKRGEDADGVSILPPPHPTLSPPNPTHPTLPPPYYPDPPHPISSTLTPTHPTLTLTHPTLSPPP